MSCMKCLLLFCGLTALLIDVVVTKAVDVEASPTESKPCDHCNEWVGISAGLTVSFLAIVAVLIITVLSVIIVRMRKRREEYEEFS